MEPNPGNAVPVSHAKKVGKLPKSLTSERADMIILREWQGLVCPREKNIEEANMLNPPLLVKEGFMYPRKNRGGLVPRIAESFHAMKTDGTYRKIYQRILTLLGVE